MTGDGDGDERRDGHHGHDHVDWVAMASFLSAWDDLDEPVTGRWQSGSASRQER